MNRLIRLSALVVVLGVFVRLTFSSALASEADLFCYNSTTLKFVPCLLPPGVTPVVSTTAEASHVIKASAGDLYSIYATNLTATPGFLVVLNATSAPADGAIAPLACVPLPSSGVAWLNWAPGSPATFSTGITAVLTSASSCFTKTTGVITGFISGNAS